ncbi:hypothetical protein KAR91_21795 [Candidatus Pacearchaeota archaeon]|nr:hypothetical protein [Candidatus Pacearchaeota archaeon]
MVDLEDKEAADLERVMSEVHSRLARRYGLSKSDIAKMAFKRYGGDDMTEKTDEVLADFRSRFNQGGKKDVMERMMEWEMIKGLKRDNDQRPPPQYQQDPQQPLQQPRPQPMQMQDMMMYPMMMMMIKSMSGGEDDVMKIFKLKLLMGDDGDGKGMNLEKVEDMMREERAASEAKMNQLMNTMFGQQEAEKLRAEEMKWRKEMEQRTFNAEQLARHPIQPQEAFQSAREKLDESLGMMTDMKAKMEQAGMVERPESIEDKDFTKDMSTLKHKQGIESEAVRSLSKSVDKLATTSDHTLNRAIDIIADEQKVKQRQLDMASPEERARLQAQYESLGEQVLQEEGERAQPEATGDSDLAFSDEDDLDVTD